MKSLEYHFFKWTSSVSFLLFWVFYKFYYKLCKNVRPVSGAGIWTHELWNISLLPKTARPGLPPTVCLQKWDMKWTKIDENEAGLVICKRHSTHTSILRLRNDSLRETIGGIYRWARSSNGTLWKWFRLKLRGRYFMKDVWKSYFIEIYFHRRHRARITTSWMPFQQT